MLPTLSEQDIIRAASEGHDAFLALIADTVLDSIGGELNADTMSRLNGEQITLLAYRMLHDEVMDGGFIQLIHNGLGPFIFLNPFAKAMRLWGEAVEGDSGTAILHDFSKLIYKGRKLFEQYGEALTQPCTDEEFMALFEQYPAFDDLDDTFVEAEEEIQMLIAHYVDEHLDQFVEIRK
ncbi:MAG: DMP19 family protein [Bacteroidaceae bacterium]|nr:DMP19 family protein [Bacteroidaceae bacterium]MBR1755649.1 DMP19 family protein [Bacteroidaceae bacterium]